MNTAILSKILSLHNFYCDSFTRITTGKFNESYICKLSNDKSRPPVPHNTAVIRIAPPDDTGFIYYEKNMMAQEPELHQIIRKKTSIPVPEIFEFDNSRKIIDQDFLIEEYIPGTALSEAWISPTARTKILKETGLYLRELHLSCTGDAYGYLGQHKCMEGQNDWVSAFRIMWNKLINDIVKCNVYDENESDDARKALDKHTELFKRDVPASLLHMDIWDQNIMIHENGSITGIVDWDRALWGDPEIEFAVLDYCGFNTPAFWKGYGKTPENTKASRIRMMFYHLYEVQKYLIIWTLRRPNPSRVSSYKQYSLDKIKGLL